MIQPDPFLTDEWKNLPSKTRKVRLEPDGTPWTGQCDPVMRERIVDVYNRLCAMDETGRQIVAVHQEISADLEALIQKKIGDWLVLAGRLDHEAHEEREGTRKADTFGPRSLRGAGYLPSSAACQLRTTVMGGSAMSVALEAMIKRWPSGVTS